MGKGAGESGAGRRLIDRAAKRTFLAALKRGERLRPAAGAAGFHLGSLYNARKRDPGFAEAWGEALELSAFREQARATAPTVLRDDETVAPNKRRALQRRKVRSVRFDARRQAVFLAHFAGTCDLEAAAAAAGVGVSTVNTHRREDADFAEGWDDALRQGYVLLEAEAVRQRLAARERLRAGVMPEGEVGAEFERMIKLLTRYERRDGRIGQRAPSRPRGPGWSFAEAMAALERRLEALAIPLLPPPPALPDGEESA